MGRVTRVPIPIIRRGEVWLVDLEPVVGHEQGGHRPVLVVSNDRLHAIPSNLITILPITRRDRQIRSHVPIQPPEGGLAHPSFVVTEQVRTISRLRLGGRLGKVGAATLASVDANLRWFLDL